MPEQRLQRTREAYVVEQQFKECQFIPDREQAGIRVVNPILKKSFTREAYGASVTGQELYMCPVCCQVLRQDYCTQCDRMAEPLPRKT